MAAAFPLGWRHVEPLEISLLRGAISRAAGFLRSPALDPAGAPRCCTRFWPLPPDEASTPRWWTPKTPSMPARPRSAGSRAIEAGLGPLRRQRRARSARGRSADSGRRIRRGRAGSGRGGSRRAEPDSSHRLVPIPSSGGIDADHPDGDRGSSSGEIVFVHDDQNAASPSRIHRERSVPSTYVMR